MELQQTQIDFNSLSFEELKKMDRELEILCSERRKDPNRRYPLTEAELKTWDIIRFFLTKKEFENETVKVGDLFYTSWGYDQTNTEMFKVVGFTKSGKSAIIRQIGMKTVPGSEGFMCDSVQPDPDFEIKSKVVDEHTKLLKDTETPLPDLKVKIERSRHWNPITKLHEEVGKINLRGSVYYGGDSKHLQNLYRIEKDGSTYRSWYA